MITTRATEIVRIASTLQDLKKAEAVVEKKKVDAMAAAKANGVKIAAEIQRLEPFQRQTLRNGERLRRLDGREVAALVAYIEDPPVAVEAARALQEAASRLATARAAAVRLKEADLDDMAFTESPSAALLAAVNAICICLGRSPDFAGAQIRLMRPGGAALIKRVIALRPQDVRATADSCIYPHAGSNSRAPPRCPHTCRAEVTFCGRLCV